MKICEICGNKAIWDCEHTTGRTTYRCSKHQNYPKVTLNKRKVEKEKIWEAVE